MADAKPILMTAADAALFQTMMNKLRAEQQGIGANAYLSMQRRHGGGVVGGGSVPAGTLFAVKVKKVGGEEGSLEVDCSLTYDVYAALVDWPESGDPPAAMRLAAGVRPLTLAIPKLTYKWTPPDARPWGWGMAFKLSTGVPPMVVTYLYHVADEHPARQGCDCG